MTHACLNRLRNRRKRDRLALGHFRVLGAENDPGNSAEWAIAARAVLASLPDQLAHVAVYYYLDEMSQREIAEVLGCSHRHVGALLARLSRWAEQQERKSC